MIERRKGTIRNQRINHTLINCDFKIDDRSFEDLLAYITSYIEYINFYTTDNEIDGNWKALIEQDAVIYMVQIIKEPVNSLTTINITNDIIKVILDWYSKIENWYFTLVHLEEEILANKIGNIVTDVLQSKKNDILEYTNTLKKEESKPKTFSEALKFYTDSSKQGVKKEIHLDEVIHTFKKAILHIQNFTRDYLKTHVFERNDHMPNNAMYMTFVMLYKKIQQQINAISQDHLDFYYKNVLQQTLSEGIQTQAIVCFELLPKSKSIAIAEGTQFTAGKLFGSKKNTLFETNKPVLVNPIQVESLQTLYFNRSPYIKIGTDTSLISNIIKNTLFLNSKKIKNTENWSLFGANENTLVNSEIALKTVTDIGFMIGSQVLFLEEGEREINLTFTLEEDTSKNVFWKLLRQMVSNHKLPLDVIFNMVFEEAFIISYTSIKGWETVNSYDVLFDEKENAFILRFLLNNTAPAFTTLESEKQYSSWPMVKVVFDEYAPVYAYSFFKGVILETITIDVTVTGIKNLALYNNIGKMPLTKSFDLFGPQPSLGGYLMIGKSELFKKELTGFDIHIDWDAVPADYGGFETYYKAYSEKFDNDSFIVELAALSNGYWFPKEKHASKQLNLFTTEPCQTPEGYDSVLITNTRTFSIDNPGEFQFSRDYKLEDPIKYDVHTQSGFLRLTLTAPKDAFGKDLYQKNYTEIATYNAKNEEIVPLPNKAFIPKVKKVVLDYTATDVIYFNNSFSSDDGSDTVVGDYIHITPFGIEKTVKDSKVYKNTMISDFEGEGYLYISLSGVSANVSVSLFFDLHNDSPSLVTVSDNIIIQYKELDTWITLTEKFIISDGTNKLTKSGIIELILPDNNQEDDEQKYELRFVAIQDAYVYPIINGIYPNAVVTSCISKNNEIIGKNIAANSITKSVKKLPEVKKVMQPAPSYGGKIPGTQELFYTEVSERLRHKDRAVTIWDYERLILQYFEEVVAVKCTNLDQNFKQQAGKVTLIVLSSKWKHQKHKYFNSNELEEIAKFIRKKSNSFIRVVVRNPTVEWLLVNCVVEFYTKENGGYYINELNTFISNYLCPLSHKEISNIEGIGAVVVPRMLKSHIENLPYIKTVKRLDIEHIVKEGIHDFTMKIYEGSNEIIPTKPWSILAPEPKHNILMPSVLEEGTIDEIEMQNLQVGVDFIIGDDDDKMVEIKQENLEKEEINKKNKTESNEESNTVLTFKLK